MDAQAVAAASRVFGVGLAVARTLSPREAAEKSYYAGGPSVDELEERITAARAAA